VRRAPDDPTPAAEAHRRVRCHHSDTALRPGVHINYAETVLPMRDGLPKLKDFPAEFGGSGEEIAE